MARHPVANLDEIEFDDIEDNGSHLPARAVQRQHRCEPARLLIGAGRRGEAGVRKIFRAEQTVDYYDRENTEPPTGA